MGISIAYKGKLKSAELLPDLIDEITDIVKIHEWDYSVFEYRYPKDDFYQITEDVFGILFSPPKCEPLYLTFLSNGQMVNPFFYKYIEVGDNQEDEKSWIFTKTQYAGIEVHKVLIQLFRYISGKYLEDFKMIDEGGYWETDDEKVLQANFEKYDKIMDNFEDALVGFLPQNVDDTWNMIIEFLKYMSKKFGDPGTNIVDDPDRD